MITMQTFKTRQDWLEARQGRIGGSDAAAILGLNDSPKPVKGVYNIDYQKDSGRVIVTTRINYIEQDGDKLIVNGKPTFNKVQ